MNLNDTTTPAERLPLAMPVNYRRSYARRGDQGKLVNISITGAFLQVADPELQPQDKVLITFSVSGRERKINASVIWRNEKGCGVKFHPFNNRDVQIVDDLIYYVESRRESRRSVLDGIFRRVS